MGGKKRLAAVLTAVLCIQGLSGCIVANAEETGKNLGKAEYIVQVRDEKTLEKVEADNRQDIVEEPGAEELEEQQMTVLELTEKEAKKMERGWQVSSLHRTTVAEFVESILMRRFIPSRYWMKITKQP